ncbi:MAG: hypothetical protein Q4G51_02775 [Dermatophilus congolensis]|nr:hypothetical protein [Dermatophilus congolensis]
MGTIDIVSWILLALILVEAAVTIRSHLTGRSKKTPRRAILSAVGLVVTALFFAYVIRWNEVVPVALWWLASALVAVAVGVAVARPGVAPESHPNAP